MAVIWYEEFTPRRPISPEDVFKWTGIVLKGLTDDTVSVMREKAMRTLEKESEEERRPEYHNLVERGVITIATQDSICFWAYIKVSDKEGNIYVCKQEDISKEGTLDALDVFVLKEWDEAIPRWSIIEGVDDDDAKVRIEACKLDRKIHGNRWGYARCLKIKWQKNHHLRPSFAICRIRDLHVWIVPPYSISP